MAPRRASHALRRLALALVFGGLATAASTQQAAAPSAIVVIDPERVFDDSAFGRRVEAEIDTRSATLAEENAGITAELTAEEQALTDRRPTMEVAAFRELARAFDARVRAVREEQDAKLRAVTRLREDASQTFFALVADELTGLARERGAVVVLDGRTVFLATPGVDITDAAVARIDAVIGDGSALPLAPADPLVTP